MSENDLVDFSEGESFLVDFNQVEEQAGFEAIPKGRYPGQIVECDFDVSSNNNPMWKLTMEVTDGEYTGTKLFTYLTFSAKALPMVKSTLARIKPSLLEAPFDPQDTNASEQLVGESVDIQVAKQKYEGEWRNQVKGLYAAGPSESFV